MSVEYEAFHVSTFDNDLGKMLTAKAADGWEIVGAPVYTKFCEAFGWNPYAVGHQPHFLVLLRRDTSALSRPELGAGK